MSRTVKDDASYRTWPLGLTRFRCVMGPSFALIVIVAGVIAAVGWLLWEEIYTCHGRSWRDCGAQTATDKAAAALWSLQARASISAALIGASVVLVLKIAERITVRRGTATIALFHVAATCRAVIAMNIPQQFVDLLARPEPGGFADQAREEDYLAFFDKASAAIAELDRSTIARLTEYAVYLKIARDATRSMARWSAVPYAETSVEESQRRRRDVLAILYALFLNFEAADACIARLASAGERRFLERLIAPSLVLLHTTLAAQYAAQRDDGRRALLAMARRTNRIARLQEIEKTWRFG